MEGLGAEPGRALALAVVGALGAAAVGCAHEEAPAAPASAAPAPPEVACSPLADPLCVDVEARETKARVERADRDRRRAAFRARVASWRADLQSRTASVARAPAEAESPPDPLLAASGRLVRSDEAIGPEVPEVAPAAPVDGPAAALGASEARRSLGSSNPAPRLPGGPALEGAPLGAKSDPRSPAARDAETSPEVLLAAAACLLADDLARVEARVRSARAEGRSSAPSLALAWVDATELAGRITRAAPAPRCRGAPVRRARASLRDLVGPAPTRDADVDEHARGLRRLDAELQARAGLPGPPDPLP